MLDKIVLFVFGKNSLLLYFHFKSSYLFQGLKG